MKLDTGTATTKTILEALVLEKVLVQQDLEQASEKLETLREENEKQKKQLLESLTRTQQLEEETKALKAKLARYEPVSNGD